MTEPLWTITGITDITQFEQGIGAVQSKRIDFKVVGGMQSFVTVPLSHFNKDHVSQVIQDAAVSMIEVRSLEGPDISQQPDFTG
jgi:hypothetical protein